MNVFIARLRIPLLVAAVPLLALAAFADAGWAIAGPGFALFALGLAGYFVLGRVTAAPTVLQVPVGPGWTALNSPASRVPSHGLHAYGQTYAIDLVKPPRPDSGPPLPPDAFPAFGADVHAPVDGTVVRVRQNRRDHRTRHTWATLPLFFLESALRELAGPGRMMGNSVIVEHDGRYVLLAHLRKGSVTVAPGDRVHAGQRIAACGNSGNSTEPHLHVQVMDHPRPIVAAGLPMEFASVPMPRNGDELVAP